MTKETLAPFPWNWLEELDPVFVDLEGIPLSSVPKGFSLENFDKKLSDKLKVQGVVEILEPVPFEGQKGKTDKTVSFSVPGISGSFSLVVPRAEVEDLLLFLLRGKREGAISDDYLDPFWHFLVETIKGAFLESFSEGAPLTLQETGEAIPNGLGLQYPLQFSFQNETFSAGLVVSDVFIKEWRKSGLKGVRQNRLADLLRQRVEIPIDIVVGGVELSKSDWKKIEAGDTILLDHLTFDPGAAKGDAIFFFGEYPLFRIKAKTGAIKIIEPAKGVKIFMPIEEQPQQQEQELLHEGETDLLEGEENLPEGTPTIAKEDRGNPIPIHDLPLQVRIEMRRFKLPLNEVLQLQEGNILKMDVDPRKGVDLVVEGKVIGRGELVKIGDLVGVRITDLQ